MLSKNEINQLKKIIPKKYNKLMGFIVEKNIYLNVNLYYKGISIFKIHIVEDYINSISIYGINKEYNEILYNTLEYLIELGITGILKNDTYL